MMKQIGIHGQRVKLYSPDSGHTWSSSPQLIIAYGLRKKNRAWSYRIASHASTLRGISIRII